MKIDVKLRVLNRLLGAAITLFISAHQSIAGGIDLSEYWTRPVPESSRNDGAARPLRLHPDDCASCHEGQYADWRRSLHGLSAGPGLIAQLSPTTDPQTAISCYYCHAPLSSQNEVIVGRNRPGSAEYQENVFFDEKLKLSGVSCAVCHVRNDVVFGPPMTGGLKASRKEGHYSVQEDYFEKAEFCAACHQLEEGYELNGKLLVNTFNEWKESEYGKSGITCQTCHMPGRKHLFRGIHDPEMVKSGVGFYVEKTTADDRVRVKLRITNSGVGHYFPTYVTPQVVIKGFLIDAKGRVLKGTAKEERIGRKVSLDLSRELFDTRIPPLKSHEFEYVVMNPTNAYKLVFEIRVLPDEFYNRFFENAVKRGDASMKMSELKKALKTTSDSGYLLFKREIFIAPG